MSNQMVCKEVRGFVLVGVLRVCDLYLDLVIHRVDVGLELWSTSRVAGLHL